MKNIGKNIWKKGHGMSIKGQGMSINVIIIAVLALLVLVVLAFIFTGKIGKFSTTTANCEAISGGKCEIDCYYLGSNYVQDSSRVCLDNNGEVDTTEVCCVKVGG